MHSKSFVISNSPLYFCCPISLPSYDTCLKEVILKTTYLPYILTRTCSEEIISSIEAQDPLAKYVEREGVIAFAVVAIV